MSFGGRLVNSERATFCQSAHYSFVHIRCTMFVFLLLLYGHFICPYFAFEVPCTQKLIGSRCLFDEECYGQNTVCRDQRCVCPTGFEQFDLDATTAICRPAPSAIGDACQRDCKPPLLCRDGKCECWGGNVVSGQCVVSCPHGQQLYGVECMAVAKLGQLCKKNENCIEPFNDCRGGVCTCTPGTIRDLSGKCITTCPDGHLPRQTCRRMFINDIDLMDNKATTDSCQLGYRCVAYGSPFLGHCCRIYCPFGEPDHNQSCDVGAPSESKCRTLTHYCHSVSEPGWKGSLCCPRPCREPTPLLIDGRCMAIGHRQDPCQTDKQCEGGITMRCQAGQCVCKPGFKPRNDDRFPTCGKTCLLDEVEVAGSCMVRVELGDRCIRSRQCPNFSECRFGRCQCQCGYKIDQFLGNRCTNPDDPLSLNTILSGVERIFNRGTGEGRIGGFKF